MRWIALAAATAALAVSTAAEAQYYPYPPGAYYPPPQRYYREPPPDYYQQPYPRYRNQSRYYPRGYGDSQQPLGAVVRGDGRGEPWRPRFDPRNGGYYCIQAGFTVQDGVCKPGRPY